MSGIAVCTDSSSLLPLDEADKLGVEIVPIAVALDGEPFDERVSTLDGFYDRVSAGARATTSLPSPAHFLAAYGRAAALGADAVISIHLDARASGTVAAAELAARDAEIPVHVVDTRTASFGVALCVRAAVGVAVAGGSADAVVREAARVGASLQNAFVARRSPGGRVPETDSWVLLTFRDGVSSVLSTRASVADAVDALVSCVPPEHGVAVGHAARDVGAAADDLARALRDAGHTVERYRVGAAVGAHTGALSFGMFWWPVASS